MKRFKTALTILMLLSIVLSTLTYTNAENKTKDEWKPDIQALMKTAKVPATTTIRYDLTAPQGAEVQEKKTNVELVSSKGDVLNVEVVFELVNLPLNTSQWQEVAD